MDNLVSMSPRSCAGLCVQGVFNVYKRKIELFDLHKLFQVGV